MIKEAIILAGGLGTRLREAVPHLPKCMAPVNDRPFIGYVIDHLRMQGIEHFIFSLGYKANAIQEYLQSEYATLMYTIVMEDEPLGTGGAIQLALLQAKEENVLVTNGDTLFKVSVDQIFDWHLSKNSNCTLALKTMENFDRYGVVEIDGEGKITSFLEKQFYRHGLINGGVYIVNKNIFSKHQLPVKFSFEKDFLEAFYKKENFFGLPQNKYFIDIGIPEDFLQAGKDLQKPILNLQAIDGNWTLFLDRDGVINNELPGTYVLNTDEFIFSDGVLEAFPLLSKHFGRIIVVSNQRGIAKKLMSKEDINRIHIYMGEQIKKTGSHLTQIYYCPDLENTSFNRKPNPGMALQAKRNDPEIDFAKSIMVGNKLTDMGFGRAAGMFTVFITSTDPGQTFPHRDIDLKFTSLLAFAKAL